MSRPEVETHPTVQVITMGRVSVDLYPEQIEVPLEEVRSFGKFLGGSPTNVAVAAARLGHRSAVVTKVGDDPFGAFVRSALEGFGVDPRWVGTHAALRTPIVFCEVFPPDHFPLLFYREPQAPDMTLTEDDVDLDAVASVPLFWTTGTGLSDEPSRSTTLKALTTRPRRGITVHDLDYRAMFWESEDEARRWGREALRHATVTVGNEEEVSVVLGERLPAADAALALIELGVDLAVVKRGIEGTLARTADEVVEVAVVPVEVVNGLGAGDAFGGALCHGLLEGWSLERTIRFANAAGAFVAARLACADAMPTEREVEKLLGRTAD